MTSTLPPLVQAFSGALGSAVSNVGSYPLDLVSTRVLLSRRPSKGVVDAHKIIKKTVHTEGVSGLYAGLESDTGATILSNFIYYYAYSLSRASLLKRKSRQIQQVKGSPAKAAMLSVAEELALGFLAGVVSRMVTTPLSVVTVRLQSENDRDEEQTMDDDEEDHELSSKEKGSGIVHVFKSIYAEQGLGGFWSGFHSTILLCLNPSFTLFFFQLFRRLFLRGKDRELPTPRQAFFGAAFSNAMAVFILFPLILAKTRLQAKDSTGRRPPSSIFDVWQQAVRKQGVSGLYQGLEVQMLKGFLNQGMAMMVKQRMERIIVALYLRSR